MYNQAETLYHQVHGNQGLANTLLSRADLLSLTGQLPQAQDMYAQAETLYRQVCDNLGLANTLKGRALLHLSSHDYNQTLVFLFRALPLYESVQEPWGIALTCALLSQLCPLFEDYAPQAPMLKQRAQVILETLLPNQKEKILSILGDED